MSPIGSYVVGNMLFVTCHLILCIGMWLLVTSYTQPGNAYWVIGWLLYLPEGDALSPRGGVEYVCASHTLGINTPSQYGTLEFLSNLSVICSCVNTCITFFNDAPANSAS
jgi:hypothetical protein